MEGTSTVTHLTQTFHEIWNTKHVDNCSQVDTLFLDFFTTPFTVTQP